MLTLTNIGIAQTTQTWMQSFVTAVWRADSNTTFAMVGRKDAPAAGLR